MDDQPLVFAALCTTGPAPGEDRVLEAAAVRVTGADVAAEFAEPAAASRARRATPRARKRAGLGASPARSALLRGLLKFCGEGRVVVYDAAQFRSFFEATGLQPPCLLDALQLAHIALPQAQDYSLEAVAERMALNPAAHAGAAARPRLLWQVWCALTDELAALPPVALDALCRAAEAAHDPLAATLAEAVRKSGFALSADADQAIAGLFPDNRALLRQAQKEREAEAHDEPVPTDAICRMFTPAGALGRRLPQYEHREEQVEMVRAVCEALNGPHHLVAEAATGTGKSLAYLLPAVAWTCTNSDKVVVSTNTRNLQEQLYRKDLPFLKELLPGRFEAALLKGRRNYLCVRRFVHLLRHFERELAGPVEYAALLPLISWAARTECGDLAECNGFLLSAGAPAVAAAVVSGPDDCAGPGCRVRDRCFVSRARALAQLADVIVVNHALLFAELGLDSRVLPPYRCVIFDEAHNLEGVATEALSVVMDGPAVSRPANRIFRLRRDGSGSGLLATVMYGAGRVGQRAAASAARAKESAGVAMKALDEVNQAAKQFLELLAEPFMEVPPDVERVLLSECCPSLGPGSGAWDAAQRLRETVSSLGATVEQLALALEKPEWEEAGQELADDLRAQLAQLRAACDAAQFVLSENEEAYVYWAERATWERGTQYSVHAAPLHVGRHVRDFFFNEKRCVVLTSATLQVDGSFDYTLERLGADTLEPGRIRCMSTGSPFDYERQSLVGVATFLPDPGGRRDRTFDDELARFLVDLLQCTRGRALVLFTSYSLLDAVYSAVRDPLQRAGIMVLAQGHSGSVEAITSLFRDVTSSVLLGTRSYWEGVDISGETLSCLVLTKLPFHVFTDPLVRGRTEYLRTLGKDPFEQYTLPEAVISFRQGFGRLIRSRTDTGVVVVTDRRLATKAYGRTFLNSLPTRHQVWRTPEEALHAVRSFCERA